ncbi:hypothetical protein KEM55_003345 [Ascosphaera atra]|nr:hypothetical protein KEM55_003345 [Ascosphaera atra]
MMSRGFLLFGGEPGGAGEAGYAASSTILICKERLGRSHLAEIIHVRHPPLEKVVARMKSIFHNEGVPFDTDGVRRLCEASWGLTGVKDRSANSRGVGEGDIRAIMVAGEWIAHKLRADGLMGSAKLTKRWVDKQFLNDSARDSSNLGRGGSREVVERVFLDGAGFATASLPKDTFQDPYDRTLEAGAGTGMKIGVADLRKRHAMTKLGQMVDAAGDHDRCITDCFTRYPTHHYQDDTFLTKPSAAYDWLDFHDHMSSRVHASQAWELSKYLNLPVLAFHHLFASANTRNLEKTRGEEEEEDDHPFAGPRADFAAYEAMKQHHATLVEFQASMSPSVLRTFRSLDVIATELVPSVNRMLSPDIKPTLVGGAGKPGIASVRKESEKALLRSATRVMAGLGIDFERVRVEREGAHDGWAYRMEPPLDTLNDFHMPKGVQTDTDAAPATVRYAVRQALAQERHKETLKRTTEAGQAKLAGPKAGPEKDARPRGSLADRLNGPKRDFFGRVVAEPDPKATQEDEQERRKASERKAAGRVGLAHAWIAYHEGFSNAVRKRITMQELFMGL